MWYYIYIVTHQTGFILSNHPLKYESSGVEKCVSLVLCFVLHGRSGTLAHGKLQKNITRNPSVK